MKLIVNKGRSIISFIIFILILVILMFILYEIFYVDILGIMNNDVQVQTISEISNTLPIKSNSENVIQNVEQVEPIINNNLR